MMFNSEEFEIYVGSGGLLSLISTHAKALLTDYLCELYLFCLVYLLSVVVVIF